METILTLAAISLAHFVAVASPGPSLVVVAQTAISNSRIAAIWNAIGIGIGTTIWAVSALLGLAVLFKIAPWVYVLIKTAGACFLIYLAYRLWSGANRTFAQQSPTNIKKDGPLRNFNLGLVTQLSNPKVVIFFGSIFVTMVPQDADLGMLVAVTAIAFLIETLWYSAMAYAFATPAIRDRYIAKKAIVDRVSATFLGFLGVGLLLDRR